MDEKTAQKERPLAAGFALLKKDLKENWPALTAVAVYILAGSLLFGTICPAQLLFGLPCPGCGLTRAAILLATAHPVQAFRMHPFLYGWIIVAADFAINRYILRRRAKELLPLLGILCVGMLIFYGYRMLTMFPNEEPMQPLSQGLTGILPVLIRKLAG